MKKTISLLTALALSTTLGLTPVLADNSTMPMNPDVPSQYAPTHFKYTPNFSDVPSDWAYRSITEMSIKGVINGDGLGKFAPGNSVTKEQAILMTVRAMGLGAQAEALGQNATLALTDASSVDTWARPYVAIALQNGILDANTTLNPKANAEREWIAQLVVRAIGEETTAQAHMKDTLTFKDAASVSANEVGYIAVASDLGILHGTDQGYLLPHAPVKRNQMAVILCNAEHLFEYNKNEQAQTQGQLSGTVTSVSSAGITLQTPTKQTVTYSFAGQYYVFLGEQMSNLNALQSGMWVRVLLNPQGQVVFVQAKKNAPTPGETMSAAHGTVIAFTAPTSTKAGSITINQWASMKRHVPYDGDMNINQLTLPVAANAQILVNGTTQTGFGSIKAGQNVVLSVQDHTVVGIDVTPKAAYPIEYPPAL
ncbi:MAG: S-layer homology domain-containing protein [Tumebacillaceae bacterium]